MTEMEQYAKVEYCYLTTTGRKTGKPHEIEIWFGAMGDSIYLMSGGGGDSDWVKNLLKEPKVKVRIEGKTFDAIARIVQNEQEKNSARNLLADKYKERESDGSLSDWAKNALVVAFDFEN